MEMKLTRQDLERFVADQRSADYRDLCRYVLQGFVGRELREDEVRGYARRRYRNPNSYNLCLALFKSFSKWKRSQIPPIDRDHLMHRFELEQIEGIRRERVVRRVEKKGLELGEVEGVLRKYKDDPTPFATIWLLMYFGCRPGELVALKPRMVDWRRRVVRFVTGKTKVEREVHFDGFTAKQLKHFLDVEPSYAFVYRKCKEAGVEPKSGRQSFITHQMRQVSKAGWDPVRGDILVKSAAGHNISDISGVYADLTSDLKKLFLEHHYMKPLEEKFQ